MAAASLIISLPITTTLVYITGVPSSPKASLRRTRGCCASLKGSVIRHEKDHPAKVFCDESKGIVCYRDALGEVTCEGFDEGPHFHPSSQHTLSRIAFTDYQSTGFAHMLTDEAAYICIRDYMGMPFCEGKDES